MNRLISPTALDGLSEAGRKAVREEAYQTHEKSAGMAMILLLTAGGLAAHRFYLGQNRVAALLVLVNIGTLLLCLRNDLLPLWSSYAVAFVLIEGFLLGSAVKKYNKDLSDQLDREMLS